DGLDGRGRAAAEERARVAQPREVAQARPHAELFEELVAAGVALHARDTGVRVREVAEDDRVRRADLLAGGLDLAVADLAAFEAGEALGRADPLHAERALL